MVAVVLVLAVYLASVQAQLLRVRNEEAFPISPVLFSAFFESEIHFGSEGGLYAELIANRDFEALGRGQVPGTNGTRAPVKPYAQDGLDPYEPAPVYTDYRPWTGIHGARLATDNSTHPFASNPTVLRVKTSCLAPPCLSGVQNPGYWGIGVRAGMRYNFSFYAQTGAGSMTLLPILVSKKGYAVAVGPYTAIRGNWTLYHGQLVASQTESDAVFQLGTSDSGTFWLDSVSVFPADAVAGLFRRDIFDAIAALRPGFLRVPGGNYLEGTGPRTRWNWKTTIGPRQARPGHYNSAWGYWVTDGMGLYELLVLAEALGTQSLMGIYTGYSMGQPYMPLNESAVFVQDALDLVEYANGPAASTWGAARAAAGHATPFGLNRLEIGNEERLMAPDDYPGHYRIITDAIWKAYPDINIIASGRWGPNITGNPCLTGQRCDMWDDHYYRSPDVMATMGGQYNDYNRSWPDVFVGEFAAHTGDHQTLGAGVAEAIFMLGFEANGDKVKASSFAPLLRNVAAVQDGYDLINFNTSQIYCIPSYAMQIMLQKGHLDTLLWYREYDYTNLTKSTAGLKKNSIVIKIAHYSSAATTITVQLQGFGAIAAAGTYELLTSAQGADAQNTLDQPHNVATVSGTLNTTLADSIVVQVPAWSVQTIHVPLLGLPH
eukprot:m.134471 g.134471  ORF g.134471 m.134471 type:complete len:659 (+) comp9518_c0_seq3:74-2050(+)